MMDYLVPTAMEIPAIEIERLETPPIGPVNFRAWARAEQSVHLQRSSMPSLMLLV